MVQALEQCLNIPFSKIIDARGRSKEAFEIVHPFASTLTKMLYQVMRLESLRVVRLSFTTSPI